LGIIGTDFDVNTSPTDEIFCIRQTLEKKWGYNGTVHHSFRQLDKAYNSMRKEVLHNILTEIAIPMILDRLIKIFLNETYSNVRIGESLWMHSLFRMV